MATHPTYTLDQIIQHLTTSWGDGDTNTETWHAAGHQLTIDGPWGNPTPRLGYGDQLTYSLGVAPPLLRDSTRIRPVSQTWVPCRWRSPNSPSSFGTISFRSALCKIRVEPERRHHAQLLVDHGQAHRTAFAGAIQHSTLADASNGDKGIGHEDIWLASSWPELERRNVDRRLRDDDHGARDRPRARPVASWHLRRLNGRWRV